jgi:hypothetical protein
MKICAMLLLLSVLLLLTSGSQCGIMRVPSCANVGLGACLGSYQVSKGQAYPCEFGVHADCRAQNATCSNICTCVEFYSSCDLNIPVSGCAPLCAITNANVTFQCGMSMNCCFT